MFASRNRGGLAGSVFELDDRMTAYDVPGVVAARFDGAKMLCRIDLDDPATGREPVLAALQRVLGIAERPVGTHVHRWSLARPTGEREAAYLLSSRRLGVCGDGWGPVSKVEGAWLSGTALGEALAADLTA